VWPLNKQGEKQSIPPGQLVPPGYAKHQKIATKHFTAGYKLAQERSYSEEDMIEASKYGYNFHKTTQFQNQEFDDSCIRNTQQWLTQFKKK
jgi:hypothetical protein